MRSPGRSRVASCGPGQGQLGEGAGGPLSVPARVVGVRLGSSGGAGCGGGALCHRKRM